MKGVSHGHLAYVRIRYGCNFSGWPLRLQEKSVATKGEGFRFLNEAHRGDQASVAGDRHSGAGKERPVADALVSGSDNEARLCLKSCRDARAGCGAGERNRTSNLRFTNRSSGDYLSR